MIQRWRRGIPFGLVGVALAAGIFSGTIGRPPAVPHPCADRLLPPKYYMRDCVVRVAAHPPLSESNPEYHLWSETYLFEKYPYLCLPSLKYAPDELFFIFDTECEKRFEIVDDVLAYMKKRDKSYPYTEIDYDFTIENDYVRMKSGRSFANDGEWIAEFPYRPARR